MEIIGDKYRIEKNKLGTGGFSEVFLGTVLENNQLVAIKKISLMQKKDILNKITQEIEIMQKINHPNIVKYYDVFKTPTHWYIIMEYCNAGTLDDVIKYNETASKNSMMNFNREANTYYYLNQLKDALRYIREQGYIHRDIKPMNVLLTRNPSKINFSFNESDTIFSTNDKSETTGYNLTEKLIVKLADFGLAKIYQESQENLMNTICGSPLYMGPELLLDTKYNSKADLWSFGVVMYEMLFGVKPINGYTTMQLKKNLSMKQIDFHLNKNFTSYCFDILTKLLTKNYTNRIDWDEFFSHKWFIIWKELAEKDPNMVINNSSLSLSKSLDSSHGEKILPEPTISPGTSPLGHSNLTKMKLDYYTPLNTSQYMDYPSSYPPTMAKSGANTSGILSGNNSTISSNSSIIGRSINNSDFYNNPRSRIFRNMGSSENKSPVIVKTEPIPINSNNIQPQLSFSKPSPILIKPDYRP